MDQDQDAKSGKEQTGRPQVLVTRKDGRIYVGRFGENQKMVPVNPPKSVLDTITDDLGLPPDTYDPVSMLPEDNEEPKKVGEEVFEELKKRNPNID